MLKKNTKCIFLFLLLTFFIIVPIIALFAEAVMINGRLDFSNAIQIITESGNVKTITNSLLLRKMRWC